MATSLAKVADVDRNLGNEDKAIAGFQEAIELLESLTINAGDVGLEQRVLLVVFDFKVILAEWIFFQFEFT